MCVCVSYLKEPVEGGGGGEEARLAKGAVHFESSLRLARFGKLGEHVIKHFDGFEFGIEAREFVEMPKGVQVHRRSLQGLVKVSPQSMPFSTLL